MNHKKCARCSKTVYPVEELKCLDKVWHKSCFRCTVCGMALNLKSYKGFDRMPYCSAHIPKVQATPIASTPEMKRLTNNTRIQSNVKYHEDYEREKSRYKARTSDAETARGQPNMAPYSTVAYRVGKIEHKNIVEQRKRELGELLRSRPNNRAIPSDSASSSKNRSIVNIYDARTRTHKPLPNTESCLSAFSDATDSSVSTVKISKYSFTSGTSNKDSSDSSKQTGSQRSYMSSSMTSLASERDNSLESMEQPRLMAGNAPETMSYMEQLYTRHSFNRNPSGTSVSSAESTETTISPEYLRDGARVSMQRTASNVTLTPQDENKVTRKRSHKEKSECVEAVTRYMQQQSVQTSTPAIRPTTPPLLKQMERKASSTALWVYRAIYDFEAQDTDEVSFLEGDIIYEVQAEKSGWLTGRIERTGRVGMLPANYVERLQGDILEEKQKQDRTEHFQEFQLNNEMD